MCPLPSIFQALPPLQIVPLTAGSIGTPTLAHDEPSMLCQQTLESLTVCVDVDYQVLEGNQIAATSLLVSL